MNRKLTVSVSIIMRSTKLTVIITTLYLSCDSSTSTVIIASDSTPARPGRRSSASQKKFSIPQVSRNAAIAVSRGLAPAHDGKRSDMGERDKRKAPKAVARDEIRRGQPFARKQEGGTHGQRSHARH